MKQGGYLGPVSLVQFAGEGGLKDEAEACGQGKDIRGWARRI